MAKLNGVWIPYYAEQSGKEFDLNRLENHKLILYENHYIFSTGKNTDEGYIELIEKNDFLEINVTITNGSRQGKRLIGIAKLEDLHLTIIYNLDGEEYPKQFKTHSGNRYQMMKFNKVVSNQD